MRGLSIEVDADTVRNRVCLCRGDRYIGRYIIHIDDLTRNGKSHIQDL